MDASFVGFAARSGVAAAERFVAADDAGALEPGAGATTEILLWWAIIDEQPGAQPGPPSELAMALRFVRNCSAHRRVSTHSVQGLGFPLAFPMRFDDRLFWRATDDVAPGAQGLSTDRVQRQMEAYNQLLAVREVRPTVESVRALFVEILAD